MSYAGLDAIELMDNVLAHPDSVERVGGLSHKYALPVLGTSFGADMWDRSKHGAILEYAQTVITRLQQLGGEPGDFGGRGAAEEDPGTARRASGTPAPDHRIRKPARRGAELAQPHL